MASTDIWSIIIGVLSLFVGIVAFLDEELRFIAAIGTLLLIAFLVIAQNYFAIDKLIREIAALHNELDFHRDLISIKAQLMSLRRRK